MSEYTKEVEELLNVLVFRAAQTREESLRHCKTVKGLCAKNKQLQSDLAEAINELVQRGEAMSSQGTSWTAQAMACGGGGCSGGERNIMQDFGMFPSNTDEVRRYSAERENATARLERAMTRECCKLLLSQHDPVHSLGIDRKDLKVLLDFVQLHHDPARLRRECEDLLANKEN